MKQESQFRKYFIVSSLALLFIAHFSVAQKVSTSAKGKKKGPIKTQLPTQQPIQRTNFAGELVPTEQGTVAAKLALALMSTSGYAKRVQALNQRSAPYFAVIEPILAKHHIPNDFKYMPLIESNWKADAVSSAGAVGYWQFMDDTAKDMNLRIEPGNDERMDLVKSTEAACRYLNALHKRLGSWTLAAAAYNGGMGMVEKKMIRQATRSYYEMAMNEETGYYLYRMLAMKELMQNPGRYAGMNAGMLAYADDPYERELQQARRMGWIVDEDPEVKGVPVESYEPAPGSEAAVMDSLLTQLLAQKPKTPTIFMGEVEAKLQKAGKAQLGQSWAFVVTRDAQVGEVELKTGDMLYAVVDDIDSQKQLFLRATKVVSAETKEVTPLMISAMNPVTGLLGLPMPKNLQAGWLVQWKSEF
ncbi:lytic transglycosylase domain-containing protein [Fibrella forsythiae]|uniref:lytic transglycosylase domain-containing protein n=1 Tax=Fibrella forsythiae TaxID=2817061 RepID=UPI001E4E78D4|nr:lytic transglycosylase domain-containing protein [Fibrella forsythiae]